MPLTAGALRFFYEHYGPSPAGQFYNNASWEGEVWPAEPSNGAQGDGRLVFSPLYLRFVCRFVVLLTSLS